MRYLTIADILLTAKRIRVDRNGQRKIVALAVFSILCFSATLGMLIETKTQASNTKSLGLNNSTKNNTSTNNSIVLNTNSTKNYLINTRVGAQTGPETTSILENTTDSEQPLFQVTTDNGYICTTGDPTLAIQGALDSLTEQRTTPYNIYLEGVFDPVNNIVMKDNVNLVGNNATLISNGEQPIFVHDWAKNYSEAFGSPFEIDGNPYQDWITLNNVTFRSINFGQTVEYAGQGSAIFFYDANSTGWGVSNNLSVRDCTFTGFYNAIQGLAINSNYSDNHFYNYSNNGMMFPYGEDLMIQNNTFHTPSNELTVEQYQERDGPISIQGGIGLFLMDVFDDVSVVNNSFIEGANSTGITFSSSCGNFTITENVFSGEGNAYSIDVFPRPWLSSGVRFYNNGGVTDFSYDNGFFSSSIYSY